MDNKTLIDNLSRRLDVSRDTVGILIEGLTQTIGECAAGLDSVSVPSFGTFEPKKRLERVALHPASGRRLLVPPKIVLTFKPSASLKQKIRK
ncbi:MAG: HU family DNA-binding protein [Muribaculaceae bacterium]|nr:HU family DNA-binding protein [Muribaculaceae bacterium]